MFLTPKETAERLQTSVKHVYYLLYMGRIEGCKIRRIWRIFLPSIQEFYDAA